MALETAEAIMPKIVALTSTKGDNQFTIRISSKRPQSAIPITIAMFAECALAHIANVESWLPRLVGGGEYGITINHALDLGVRLVFGITLMGSPYETINVNAMQSADWIGPTNLQNAPPLQPQSVAPVPQYVPQVSFQQPVRSFGAPMIQPTHAGAQAAMGLGASGAELLTVQREEARANAQLQAREAELNRRETEARMRAEAAEREAKIKADMDRQLAASTAEMRELKALIVAQNQRPVEKAGPSIGETLALIATAFAPIVKGIMDSNTETRKLTMELTAKQQEQAAANAREIAAIQVKAQENQMALTLKMLERPAQSPEMAAMLDLNRAHTESQGQMMSQIVNAMGTVSKMSIGMIETIADMTAPPEGSPVVDAIKEGVKALGSLANGVEKGARAGIQAGNNAARAPVQPPQPPQPPQPTPAQLEAARNRAAQVSATAEAQQRAASAAQQVPQTPPANVVQFPPPTIVPPPPASPPPSTQVVDSTATPLSGSFGEMPGGFDEVETKSSLDQLIGLLRENHEPPDAVATFFLDSLKDPAMQGALRAPDVQGDPSALVAKYFDTVWLLTNQEYVERVAEALQRLGSERGLIVADDASEPESDEPEADESETADDQSKPDDGGEPEGGAPAAPPVSS